MIPPSRITNPFPGLRPFESDQADLFFGRDEQIEELIDRLNEHRFVAVVGASGSGKSSLVRAGLIPVLKRTGLRVIASRWRIVTMRPGRNATDELAAELSKEFNDPETLVLEALRASSAGLAKYAQQKLADEESLLVLVDQFEELFRYREQNNYEQKAEDATAFVKLLLAATGHSDHPLPGLEDVPVYVVITMRSDFLGKCSQFRGLPEVLNESQYLVPRMTRDEQREAIEGPVHMVQGQIAPKLVQRLLNDVGDNPDQLPVLQHVLMRSWEQATAARANGHAIEIKDYEDVGGMKEALNRDADQAFAALPDEESRAIARNVFQRLVEPGARDEETRRPTRLSELVAVTACPEEQVRQVIDVFRARGFLTTSAHDDDPMVDIGHESLIRNWKRLSEWVVEESQSATIYRRLADNAELNRKGEAELLRDPQLQLALNWRENAQPNEAWARRYSPGFAESIAFLEKSKKAREEERARIKRQQRIVRAIVIVAMVVLSMLSASLLLTTSRAIRLTRKANEAKARADRLVYDANIFSANASVLNGQLLSAQPYVDELLSPSFSELRGFEWFYLWRVAHLTEALAGHSDAVNALAFSPDGKVLASGSYDKTIKLWDATSHRELVTLNGHSDRISALAFSPDGKMLGSSSIDKTVKLWDTASYQLIPTHIFHSEPVQSLAFSPDGKILATCSDDMTVKLWDITSGKEIDTLNGHQASVTEVAFSRDNKILASSSEDKTVILWDLASRKKLKTLTHTSEVWSITFSPHQNILASGTDDGTVKLWDIVSYKELTTSKEQAGTIWSINFSPDGQTLASASEDKTIKLWNITSFKQIETLTQSKPVRAVAFSPNGITLASGGAEKNVILLDTSAPKQSVRINAHAAEVSGLAFQPDGKILASSSEDGSVKLWETSSGQKVVTLLEHEAPVKTVGFSPDGKFIAAAVENEVKLWRTSSREQLKPLTGHTTTVLAIAFSPDSKNLASGADAPDNIVRLWDCENGQEIGQLSGHTDSVRALAFSPDGTTLASGSNDKKVKLWNIAERREIAQLDKHSEPVTSLAFSHNGKYLATGSIDETVKLWDVAERKELTTFEGHVGFVMAVAFSQDDKTLASSGLDNTVRLWAVESRKPLMTLENNVEDVNTIAFSPDGRIFASGSLDKTIKLWFAATDAEINSRRLQMGQTTPP